MDINRALLRRGEADINYELESTYTTIPGTSVRVIFEFPKYNAKGDSAFIIMDDLITISYSAYRVKSGTFTLGQNSIVGFGLGNRLVAGTINRTVFTTDKLSELQSKIYVGNQDDIKKRLVGMDNQLPSGLPAKDLHSIVMDDLSYFNIHMYSISEATYGEKDEKPMERFDSIIGATIMNTGQVYSIHDLATESTMSFQAKAYKTSSDITDFSRSSGNARSFPTGSEIMRGYI